MLVPLLNPRRKRHRRAAARNYAMTKRLRKAKSRVAALRKNKCIGWVFKKGASKRFSHLQSKLAKARKGLDKAITSSMLTSHRKATRKAAHAVRSRARCSSLAARSVRRRALARVR